MRDAALARLGASDAVSALSVIPVLVTGIQSRRVGAVERLSRAMDMALLDSCDKHRNDGELMTSFHK
jgi:hypothetical protein